ncbi:serine hydrolase domain-containing protein [Brachybacterium sacelli]|uniref:CubicO group peptidase (Beta-lactamase class C family) n=1 Tax=Brachybacterium sacelli TaxID=173364 RepID=A0ABS4WY37_9MICO|nr:serine hydrolase domain-containing protein [Brachybacterium sacelli]MBP2381119.1 CubicO group peptidase (beta-lactamase class C family) [Brachybacterium sacelli]
MSSTPAAPATLPESTRAEISALFSDAVYGHRTAGVTWAVVGGHAHDQAVLHHGAAGQRELDAGESAAGSAPMDRATISRIASMTKSFTAATLLALRDEGRLRLDDPVARYVPEAGAAFDTAADDPEITLRDLLTMGAGLVTDNPWGDRQESLTREEFAALLAGGLGHTRRPDTGFEYSNTGYALLGRVIDEVTGSDYTTQIRRRFLEPLGMVDTAFDTEALDRARLATGHRIGDRTDATRFEPVPLDHPGVYGAMAGLFSTVDDVAAWVRFLAAADAPDSAARDQALLSTTSRREMQQLRRHHALPALPVGEDGTSPGFDRIRGYGYGLVIEHFPDLGEVISHSGGYPGYGSFMVWHRASGVGVVALANSKYAPATPLSLQTLRILQREVPGLLEGPEKRAAPRTLAAASAALTWLRTDDDAVADAWFADNMDLDTSRDERQRRLDSALHAAGLDRSALDYVRAEAATVISPAQLRWRIPGRGEGSPSLRIDLLMDPRREALIQSLDTTAVAAA